MESVKKWKFNVWKSLDIISSSVCEVFEEEALSGNKPRLNGVFDPRMGPYTDEDICWTCKGTMRTCPGHFGYVDFALPAYNPIFINHVVMILKCICIRCSRLRIDKTSADFQRIKNIKDPKKRIYELSLCGKNFKVCYFPNERTQENCYKNLPSTIKSQNRCKILMRFEKSTHNETIQNLRKRKKTTTEKEATKFIIAEKVLIKMRLISDEDIHLLGFEDRDEMESLLFKIFPIPPLCIRPSNMVDPTYRREDFLTKKLSEIVRQNNLIKSVLQSTSVPIGDGGNKKRKKEYLPDDLPSIMEMLQYTILAYIDHQNLPENVKLRMVKDNGAKSLRTRLEGKQGRVRSNLMSKRVDYTARTVITPDTNLGIDQVGLPEQVARTLSFPEVVNDFNINELKHRIRVGPFKNGGANTVIKINGDRIDLRMFSNQDDLNDIANHLQKGATVRRHLKDGDVALFNRQPSLHKFSFLALFIKIKKGKTFSFNPNITTPFNADYDGDEMNIHIPQSYETAAEAIEIMGVKYNILTPQGNRPVMGLIQDSILGPRCLSSRNTFLNKTQVFRLCNVIHDFDVKNLPPPCIMKPEELWSGKQIISLIFPSNLFYTNNATHHRLLAENDKEYEYDTKVIVRGGKLLAGNLCKKTLGQVHGSLIHVMYLEYGPDATVWFFSNMANLGKEFLKMFPESIGFEDVLPRKGDDKYIEEIIQTANQKIAEMMKEGLIEKDFEKKANAMLNKAKSKTSSDTMKQLSSNSVFFKIVTAESKGTPVNVSQIMKSIGQQNIDGARIPDAFESRTLPYFDKFDRSAEAKGFIKNSFFRGLSLSESLFQAMATRVSLIDVQCKTADSGYNQRKICKIGEDAKVLYDGTVRNYNNQIIQFVYGSDGFDASYLEHVKFGWFKCTNEQFANRFLWDDTIYLLDEREQLIKDYQLVQQQYLLTKSLLLPVNFYRLFNSLEKDDDSLWVSPEQVYLDILKLQSDIESNVGRFTQFKDSLPYLQFKWFMNTKFICRKCQMTEKNWKWLINQITKKYLRSIISPGEMVGTLAGTSIGEPSSQMTLKSFHFAGYSDKDVTLGVPRLKELLNATKNISSPSSTIYLWSQYSKDKETVLKIMKRIQSATCRDVLECAEIYYDPVIGNTCVIPDKEWIEDFYNMPNDFDLMLNYKKAWSSFVLRLEFNAKKILDLNLTLFDIKQKIANKFANSLFEFTDEYSEPCIIRIRTLTENTQGNEDVYLLEELINQISSILISGIKDITKTFLGQNKETKEFFIETSGTNLTQIFTFQEVDSTRTFSNDIYETVSIFGIEAANNLFNNELKQVISFDGTYVDNRHQALIGEILTHNGFYYGANRHGLNHAGSNVLVKASFETTVEKLSEAARFSMVDNIEGVTAPVMIGKLPTIGTNSFQVYLDRSKLPANSRKNDSKITFHEIDF